MSKFFDLDIAKSEKEIENCSNVNPDCRLVNLLKMNSLSLLTSSWYQLQNAGKLHYNELLVLLSLIFSRSWKVLQKNLL